MRGPYPAATNAVSRRSGMAVAAKEIKLSARATCYLEGWGPAAAARRISAEQRTAPRENDRRRPKLISDEWMLKSISKTPA
jgi:hypothetical protein